MKRPFTRKRLDRFLRETINSGALLRLSREDGDDLLVEASRRFDLGEIDEASTLFSLHNGIFSGSADAWIGQGACLQTKGDLVGAGMAYLSALECRPDDPFALTNLAECGLLLGNSVLARKTLAELVDDYQVLLPHELAVRVESLKRAANEAIERDRATQTMAGVLFAVEPDLCTAEFRDVLYRSTLAERRPVDEPDALGGMLSNANVIVTARIDGLLVGVSRALTDYSFCSYLSDLAVDRDHQRRGIGRELIRRTHDAAGLKTTLILLAAPAAREYYPHVGMTAHDSCWIIPRTPPTEGKSQ